MTETFEFVSPKHPDKIADQLADTILDAYLAQDPDSRCAIEVMGGHGKLVVMGEITSKGKVNIKELIQPLVPKLKIETNIVEQSPEIARGVDSGGAGDQGIMIGYACNETPNFMPYGYELARNLCQSLYKIFPNDGKVQITLDDKEIKTAVVSWCGVPKTILEKEVRFHIPRKNGIEYLINPAGDWNIGGFDADTGLTGRKVAIDNYGSRCPIGGGSFSGKDPSKVDRSAAYIARFLAVKLCGSIGDEVVVRLAYAIGRSLPVEFTINGKTPSKIKEMVYGIKLRQLTPENIIRSLNLKRPIYAETAKFGHFGLNFPWG